MFALYTLFVIAAPTPRQDDSGIRAITVTSETRDRKIPVAVTPSVFTALRLSEPFDLETVSFGKPAWFEVAPTSTDQQLNFTVIAERFLGAKVPLTLVTKSGIPLLFEISVSKAGDSFVRVDLSQDLATTRRAVRRASQTPEENIAEQHSRNESREVAVRDERQKLLRDVARGVSFKHFAKRDVTNGVILTIVDFVKLGHQGFLHFNVQNMSREPWVAGNVVVSISLPDDPQPKPLDGVDFFFDRTSVATEEEANGAVSFLLTKAPANAKFLLQVFELRGTRQVEISGVRL